MQPKIIIINPDYQIEGEKYIDDSNEDVIDLIWELLDNSYFVDLYVKDGAYNFELGEIVGYVYIPHNEIWEECGGENWDAYRSVTETVKNLIQQKIQNLNCKIEKGLL